MVDLYVWMIYFTIGPPTTKYFSDGPYLILGGPVSFQWPIYLMVKQFFTFDIRFLFSDGPF